MRPVEAYVQTLIQEVRLVRNQLPRQIKISRLHLGGGTPTILSSSTMASLLDAIFKAFNVAPDFEFSVEIDPTEAAPELLQTLVARGMNRASIGIQDFAPAVQQAIGRLQTPEQTCEAVTTLRYHKMNSLNVDLLYGLPLQTEKSLSNTLDQVLALSPDRIALYGYAHVPWMSKRQIMIDAEKLPSAIARYELSEFARARLISDGYAPVGIDHFALPTDSLAKAAQNQTLRRNFQGYTDDNCDFLIGLGASAISRFPQGYVQNASATSAYLDRINSGILAGMRGYAMTTLDRLAARMIEQIMCKFQIDATDLASLFPEHSAAIQSQLARLAQRFSTVSTYDGSSFEIKPDAYPLARIIARNLDTFTMREQAHSMAI